MFAAKSHLVLFTLAIGGAMLLSGCTAPSNGDDEKTELVEMKNLKFAPATVTVEAGTKVTWINRDSIQHNVVSDDGSFEGMEEKDLLNGGQTFAFTFDEPGTYTYHCAPHAFQNDDGEWEGMTGTIIVTGGDGTDGTDGGDGTDNETA